MTFLMVQEGATVLYFGLDTKGLGFFPVYSKKSRTNPAASAGLVRKVLLCATKNAQMETKAKATILCVEQNLKLERTANSN